MKIGICGLGRIGKTLLRKIFENNQCNIEVKVIKDLKEKNQSNIEAIQNLAYSLQNDSTYGTFPQKISVIDETYIKIGKNKIYCDFSKNITDVNWDNFNIDLLIESSGSQNNIKNVKKCISKKLKNVLITRTTEISDFTLIFGVNEKNINKEKDKIVSLSTCTGNAAAPFLKIVNEEYDIQNGYLATIHPVLSSEKSLDSNNALSQLGRASKNVKLIDTAITKSVIEVLPNLKNKLSEKSISYRIPTDIVSSVYGVIQIAKEVKKKDLINCLEKKLDPEIFGICYGSFGKELVSLDYIKDSRSSILSSFRTSVHHNLVSFHLWHDNEYGYCSRVYDAIRLFST
jgi:glyceraldehyde 3-phosphate dehydrogenase